MLHLSSLLVPTDYSPEARHAAAWAFDLAAHNDAQVHLLHVSSYASHDPVRSFFQRFLTEAGSSVEEGVMERMKEEAAPWLERHPGTRFVHRHGVSAADEILQYAFEERIGLILMGTHGHRSLTHPALGGTAGEVLRRSEAPVMTVRGADPNATAPPSPALQRILVPVDFSSQAASIVQTARDLGGRYGAALDLLFVAEERQVPTFLDTGLFSITTLQLDPAVVDRAGEGLMQLYRTTSGPEVPVEVHVRTGQAAREILAGARTLDADLIVMSTHGATGDELFTLGSVTERVVRQAPCAVLTLKASGAVVEAPDA